MNRIRIITSKSYDVILEDNILHCVGSLVKEFARGQKAAVITDNNVAPLYLETVCNSLKKERFNVVNLIISGGEHAKNIQTFDTIINFLADNLVKRNDFIIALGGGITGDLAGFAAASFLRGIDYMQIPTTLLSFVDSSVGGKTGFNLEQGKNLVGAFHQPSMVVADISTLKTLPQKEVKNGMGEVIKYAVLMGGELFDLVDKGEALTKRALELCIKYKKRIVESDEFENGQRKLLNLGHTFAHSIEKLSDFSIAHGEAVVYGIRIAAKASLKMGELSQSSYNKIIALIDKHGYSCKLPFDHESIAKAALNDKKSVSDTITLVTIKDIGDCRLTKVPITFLEEFIK